MNSGYAQKPLRNKFWGFLVNKKSIIVKNPRMLITELNNNGIGAR
jgi:hypothetical protein